MTSPKTKEMVRAVLEIVDALDAGKSSAEELRARAKNSDLAPNEIESVLIWIDLAEIIHEAPPAREEKSRVVANPRYRKGTGMNPTSWSNCLWQPPGGLS